MKPMRSLILEQTIAALYWVMLIAALWVLLRGHNEPGGGFIAALLAVALAAVLFAALLDTGETIRARTRNALRAEQTWQLARGMELWAESALKRDLQSSEGFDARGEGWGQPIPPIPIPGGSVTGLLRDGSGCLNLNDLVEQGVEQPQRIERFRRLIEVLQLDPAIADAVVDWIDADVSPHPEGAEDLTYLGMNPAYRAANRPMAHPSELRRVYRVDDAAYRALRPHICTWPQPSPINLNFASPQLWRALDPEITAAMAATLWRDGQANFRNTHDVDQELRRLIGRPVALQDVSTASEWFVLEAEVQVDGLPFRYAAVIRRHPRQVETVIRLRGQW